MKNTQSELTIKEAKEALELLQKSEGNLTKEGKEKTEQLEKFLKRHA
jgi:DNA-directed RNA polymerase subunit F